MSNKSKKKINSSKKIALLAILIGVVNELPIDFIIKFVIIIIAIIMIFRQINKMSKEEEERVEHWDKKIKRIMNIITIILIVSATVLNITKLSSLNNTYNQVSDNKWFRYNSAAVKQIEVDFICIKELAEYTFSKEPDVEYTTKYIDIEKDVPYYNIINRITQKFEENDILGIGLIVYRTYRHHSKVKNLVTITFYCYILCIWKLIDIIIIMKKHKGNKRKQ